MLASYHSLHLITICVICYLRNIIICVLALYPWYQYLCNITIFKFALLIIDSWVHSYHSFKNEALLWPSSVIHASALCCQLLPPCKCNHNRPTPARTWLARGGSVTGCTGGSRRGGRPRPAHKVACLVSWTVQFHFVRPLIECWIEQCFVIRQVSDVWHALWVTECWRMGVWWKRGRRRRDVDEDDDIVKGMKPLNLMQ